MIVRLKKTVHHPPRLKREAGYIVYGIEEGSYRLVNEDAEPCLYDFELFEVVDERLPEDWLMTEYPDGAVYISPAETNTVGFFEDWHDSVEEARRVFLEVKTRVDTWQKHLPPRA